MPNEHPCRGTSYPPGHGRQTPALFWEPARSVLGCCAREEHVVDVERRIRNELVTDAVFTPKRILATNRNGAADFVLLYRVQFRDDKVVETNKGEAYIRRASTRHLLTAEEKHELQMERGQRSFELEPCGLQWPDDFDQAAVRSWAAGVRRLRELDAEPQIPAVLVLHKLGKTIKGDFAPNNACAMLFAKDPQSVVPGCMVRFQRIEGRDAVTGKDRNVVKDIQLTGTIPQLIESAGDTLKTYLRTYSRFASGGKFYTAPEYPEEAWREAIINAVAHRSYSLKGANVFIKMFDDRLVVESPGGFPGFVTESNIYDAGPYRRNWWLMDALQFLEYVKCENEGVKRIRRAMTEMKLPEPQFEQKQIDGALVRVTLRNNQHARVAWVDAEVTAILGADRAKGLTIEERRVVNFAAEHDYKIKSNDAMQLMPGNPRWHTADKLMKRLEGKGLFRQIRRYPRDPTAYYLLLINTDTKEA